MDCDKEARKWQASISQHVTQSQKELMSCLKTSYGYFLDPDLSVRQNVINIVADMPSELYFCLSSNTAFHNLCSTTLPHSVKALLGLSLKFIPNMKQTTSLDDINTSRFIRDCHHSIFFADQNNTYKKTPFGSPHNGPPLKNTFPLNLVNILTTLSNHLTSFSTNDATNVI